MRHQRDARAAMVLRNEARGALDLVARGVRATRDAVGAFGKPIARAETEEVEPPDIEAGGA